MTLDLNAIKQRAGLKRWPTVAELGLIKDDNTALVSEVERLRGAHKRFATELDFLEPETGRYPELNEMLDPIADAFSAENDHMECARVCEACGEALASVMCEGCHGSGCGPGTALGAYEECPECAGAGKTHPSCTGASYAGLTEEVERLRGVVEEVKAFCSDPCTENCCEACNGQNEAYRQVLTILDAMEGP